MPVLSSINPWKGNSFGDILSVSWSGYASNTGMAGFYINKKIAVPAGYTLTESVMAQYPDYEYTLVKNPAEGLKLVSLGKADGFIGSFGIINCIIKKQFLNNLHVAAEITLDRDLPLYMAVRKDWALLATILDKAMEQGDSIQELKIPNQDSGVSPFLTVSLGGISAVPNPSIPGNWFINKADQLLYRAKQKGRNQYLLESL